MVWFVLALSSAFGLATADALTKRYYDHLSPYEMGLIRLLFSLPWLITSLFLVPWERPDNTFYICMVAGLPLEAAAYYGYMSAIKISPLSLTLPFLAFTPVFVLFTGYLMLKELPNPGAIVGIGLIVAGAYCLNLSAAKVGFTAPIRAIIKERGSMLMLLVSMIFGFTSVIGKIAVLHSNAYFFGAVYFISFSILQIAAMPMVSSARFTPLFKKPIAGLLTGAAFSAMIFCHLLAIALTDAANMIAVKRTSLLFGTIYGWLWFKEKNIRERLLGVMLMLGGIFAIGWTN